MKIMQKTTILLTLIPAFLLVACARPLPIELHAAEQAVADAYHAGASHTASDEYKAAEQSLSQGKKLAKSGKEEARKVLLDAIDMGHEAELTTYRYQLDLAEEHILRLEAQRDVYLQALRKVYDEKGLSEITIPDSNTKYKPSASYRVRSGENLFAIAARRKVYNDSLLWPLIYKANRDQIKDPQQIYPGQILTIPREVTDEEKEEARTIARESKIFSQSSPANGKK